MGGSDLDGGGSHIFCNDPAHSEPFACSREVEGGWVCESTHQLENILYAITSKPRLFRWFDGKIQWCDPDIGIYNDLPGM